ncbi:MAG TPA: FAD-dependent oxidoreductase [Prolixibacteraceae bacterium]|nr:FAD-dependent oxidoreductase [Prolixibacteraceae bacterium]
MERRHFLKTTAAGSAFLATSGLWNLNKAFAANPTNVTYCFQSERDIPIAYEVDVLVVGGSSAGVAAAVAASKQGTKVFLTAQETYLGEDICANFRYWNGDQSTELGKKLFGNGQPTPMHIKRALDHELISNKIGFMFSTYVTELVIDASGQPSGVVIANRSGRQAIIAKTIIDATPRAMVTRMSKARFTDYPSGKHTFNFTVVGNDKKSGEGLSVVNSSATIKRGETTYPVTEYAFNVEMPDDSWASFAKAEQKVRDLTWDANQVESSDHLFQVPPDKIIGQKQWDKDEIDGNIISLKVFQPKKTERLYVLGGCADISRKAANQMLQPGSLIRIGERMGKETALLAITVNSKKIHVESDTKVTVTNGDIGELLDGVRPSLNLGVVKSDQSQLPILGTYDVVVMGGGTAGAPAGIGAARNGASTLVIEYLHGMGGIGTLGMIGRYWYGYRHGFTNEVDNGVKTIGGDNPRQKNKLDEWVFDWKTEWYRSGIRKAGGEIWFGVIGIGAYVENKQVKGVVVATPFGRGVVLGKTIIDSTGSADIAIAAGAGFSYTDGYNVGVQGAGLPPKGPNDFYNNTDWTFTDDTDMIDVWSTFVVGKEKFKDKFDIGKLPQTRERRRMNGDFTVSVLDVYNHRTYPDTISIHESSFDTHGFTVDPFFALKPPAHSSENVVAHVPFRALLPKGLDGIIVTGLGASAHRDAMPVIRMQPCLQNQGYAVGMAASMVAKNNQVIRNVDIKELQQRLVKMGNLTDKTLTDTDNYPPSFVQVQQAAKTITNELKGLEIVMWDVEKGIPALTDELHRALNQEDKLVYARVLGMLDNDGGWEVLQKAVDGFDAWDEGWNYRGMGQFGMSMSYLDCLIIALGKTRKQEVLPSVIRMARMLTPESEFSHFRAIAIAFETLANEQAAKVLFDLLQMKGVTGHTMQTIEEAIQKTPAGSEDTSTRNNALREIILGRSLFRCGDYNGLGNQIMNDYGKDLRGHFYRHATGVLKLGPFTKLPKMEL